MSESQRRSAEDIIAHIIATAESDADRVADFLEAHGIKPFRQPDPQATWPIASGLDSPASATTEAQKQAELILRNLACALRIAHWERIGLAEHIDGLPSSRQAFKAVDPRNDPSQGERIRRQVFNACLSYFPPVVAGQDTLLCRTTDLDPDALANLLAELLWQTQTQ